MIRFDVNSAISHEDRRVPVDQMIYIADGPSDVPVFAVVKGMGGKTYAVYDPNNEKEFQQSCALVEHGRVHNNGPADYRCRSSTSMWIRQKATEILTKMVAKKEKHISEKTEIPQCTYPQMKLAQRVIIWIKNCYGEFIQKRKIFSRDKRLVC